MKKIFTYSLLITAMVPLSWGMESTPYSSQNNPNNSKFKPGIHPKAKTSGMWGSNEDRVVKDIDPLLMERKKNRHKIKKRKEEIQKKQFNRFQERVKMESELTLSALNEQVANALVPIMDESMEEYVTRTVPIFKEVLVGDYNVFNHMANTNMSKEELQVMDDGFMKQLDKNFMISIQRRLFLSMGGLIYFYKSQKNLDNIDNKLYQENNFYNFIAHITYILHQFVLNNPNADAQGITSNPLDDRRFFKFLKLYQDNPLAAQQCLDTLQPDMKKVSRPSHSVVFKDPKDTPFYFFVINRLLNCKYEDLGEFQKRVDEAVQQQKTMNAFTGSFGSMNLN
jgi:hypothetical protein